MLARLLILSALLLMIFSGQLLAVSPEESYYAIVLANGAKIKIADYAIDLKLNTVTYKSTSTGLTTTFPLERLSKVVKLNDLDEPIPTQSPVVFENPLVVAASTDDSGIPVTFKVVTKTVGSSSNSGGSKTTSTSKNSSRSSSRSSSNNSSSSTSSNSGSSYSKPSGYSGNSGSTGATSLSGHSSSSSSSSTSNPFLDALFGSNR